MRGGYRQNAGRKKGFSALEAEKARELISRKLSENLEPILEKLILEAKNGNIRATKELFDRAWGRVPQSGDYEDETAKHEPLLIQWAENIPEEVSKSFGLELGK